MFFAYKIVAYQDSGALKTEQRKFCRHKILITIFQAKQSYMGLYGSYS